MEVANLVLDYLAVLIWPTVVLAALLIFRQQIRSAIERVSEASGFGATLKMEREAATAAEQAAHIPELRTMANAELVETTPTGVAFDEDAGLLPLARVIGAWIGVEQQAKALAVAADIRWPGSVGRLVRKAADRELISVSAAESAENLQRVRNVLVHSESGLVLTAEGADSLVQAMTDLKSALKVAEVRMQLDRPSAE